MRSIWAAPKVVLALPCAIRLRHVVARRVSCVGGSALVPARARAPLLRRSVQDAEEQARSALAGGSVNLHFTRRCNYACKFCFHTEKTGGHLPLSDLAELVRRLSSAGVQKLNVAGGEPLLFPDAVGVIISTAKGLGMYTSVSLCV